MAPGSGESGQTPVHLPAVASRLKATGHRLLVMSPRFARPQTPLPFRISSTGNRPGQCTCSDVQYEICRPAEPHEGTNSAEPAPRAARASDRLQGHCSVNTKSKDGRTSTPVKNSKKFLPSDDKSALNGLAAARHSFSAIFAFFFRRFFVGRRRRSFSNWQRASRPGIPLKVRFGRHNSAARDWSSRTLEAVKGAKGYRLICYAGRWL